MMSGASPAAFVAVEAGSDEGPDLVQHPRRAEEDGPDHGELDPDDLETIHRVEDVELRRIAERLQRVRGRAADEAPQGSVKVRLMAKAAARPSRALMMRVRDFGEVLDERHARASPHDRERGHAGFLG